MSLMIPPTQEDFDRGLVLPGMAPGYWGFDSENWLPDSYLFWKPGETRVVCSLLLAKNPHNGAFRRLVNGIEADGLAVAVPTPMGQMRAVLEHYGFVQSFEDSEMGSFEIWMRPQPSQGGAE